MQNDYIVIDTRQFEKNALQSRAFGDAYQREVARLLTDRAATLDKIDVKWVV